MIIFQAPDALGSVPFKPMEVVVKRKVPYFGLKVPQQYKLSGYKSVNVQEASSGYVPIKLPKPLRTGAEVIQISLKSKIWVTQNIAVIIFSKIALQQKDASKCFRQ